MHNRIKKHKKINKMKQTKHFFTQVILNGSKKTLLIAFLIIAGLSSFANRNDEVTGEVKASFAKEFKNAKVINWDVTQKFTKVTFKLGDQVMFAFFSVNGQLLAVTRNILANQLPIHLLMDMKKNYSSYWVTDLFEISGDDEKCYYLTLENAETKVVLRSIGTDQWEVFQKENKH